uniref:Uncharacterized protein n=1 Tax=Oryza rufipogon TaxID=4529 RepID=A0A0E0QLG9_ORYRU
MAALPPSGDLPHRAALAAPSPHERLLWRPSPSPRERRRRPLPPRCLASLAGSRSLYTVSPLSPPPPLPRWIRRRLRRVDGGRGRIGGGFLHPRLPSSRGKGGGGRGRIRQRRLPPTAVVASAAVATAEDGCGNGGGPFPRLASASHDCHRRLLSRRLRMWEPPLLMRHPPGIIAWLPRHPNIQELAVEGRHVLMASAPSEAEPCRRLLAGGPPNPLHLLTNQPPPTTCPIYGEMN